MKRPHTYIVICNGADLPNNIDQSDEPKIFRLEYRDKARDKRNVKISLPDFVRGIYYLPGRILDLLEVASYIFSADRFVSRGSKDALEYL